MDMENLCVNCGEECRTSEIEGTIHLNGKYACYPKAKQSESRYSLMAESADEFSEVGSLK